MMMEDSDIVYGDEDENGVGGNEQVLHDDSQGYMMHTPDDGEYASTTVVSNRHPGIKVIGTEMGDGENRQRSVSLNGGAPRAVHQCSQCNKMFVSFKGLQQHAVIHTDLKPFVCELCGKAFRFKSNLFEHKSMHSGAAQHTCPFCQKTCRLKGNLKKHLKTHIQDADELERVWRPYASNRRPPQDIPDDAIVVRSSGDMYYSTPPARPRKKKLGLGEDSQHWVSRIKSGELLPAATVSDKLGRLNDLLNSAEQNLFSMKELFDVLRSAPFEHYACPFCKDSAFFTRAETEEHIENTHPFVRKDFYCETCLKIFIDRKVYDQHQEYHKKVQEICNSGSIEVPEPDVQDAVDVYMRAQRTNILQTSMDSNNVSN